jgi:hypothetical protein
MLYDVNGFASFASLPLPCCRTNEGRPKAQSTSATTRIYNKRFDASTDGFASIEPRQ